MRLGLLCGGSVMHQQIVKATGSVRAMTNLVGSAFSTGANSLAKAITVGASMVILTILLVNIMCEKSNKHYNCVNLKG